MSELAVQRDRICEACGGEGGFGDERCAMQICAVCDGAGVVSAGAEPGTVVHAGTPGTHPQGDLA